MSIEIKAPKSGLKSKRIVGRGKGSGRGKTSTRGHKGHKQRAGSTIKLGFEGGQMALIRRLPKYGFSNAPHRKVVEEVSLDQLDKFFSMEDEISLQSLKEKALVTKNADHAKVLGNGKISKKLILAEEMFITASARTAIENVGGEIKKKEKK